MQMTLKRLILIITLFLLVDGCDQFSDPAKVYRYSPPPSNSELEVSTLAQEDIDEAPITDMTNAIITEKFKRINSVMILRNNKLVYEQYFQGYSQDIPHNIYSSTKSIISILTGIAIDKGYIPGVSATALAFLPEYNALLNPDPRKEAITIADLLNMASGLSCDDWYAGTEQELSGDADLVRSTLDLPMLHDPGTTGTYCTGGVWILAKIIENQSGMSIEKFAQQYLFSHLNIKEYKWIDRKLFLRPRDMAKVGLLMLNNGLWEGEQVVSQEWVAQSARNVIKLPGPFEGYGNLWWKQSFANDITTYFSSGNGGQDIFIVPSKNLVVVFTTGNQNTSLGLQNIYMLKDFIFPALL
jgi:CubicO group peptidase (beta-lactamase class C family)